MPRREIHTQIHIDAPPERVWEVLTDFAAYPQWNSFIPFISGELREGGRLRIRVQLPEGSAMSFRPEVLKAEAARELRWVGRLPLGAFRGEHFMKLEPLLGGTTRFIHGEIFGGWMLPFIWAAMGAKTLRGYEVMNQELARRAEQG